MKCLPYLPVFALLLAPFCAVTAPAQADSAAMEAPSAAAFDNARYNSILSRLQSMGHGYYTAAEWKAIDDEVDSLVSDARASKDGDAIIKTAIVKAMVLADMRRLYPPALEELREARRIVSKMKNADASRLYVKEADVLAQSGDAAAVEALIAEYKASPSYHPEQYPWSGGNGPTDPLLIARPKAEEATSLPLTMMEQSLRAARSAPGLVFPDEPLTDIYGRSFRISDYRGNLLLVDFFVRGWWKWEQNLPALRNLHDRYAGDGFAIVSICLQADAPGLTQLGLPWIVCPAQPQLTRPLGIFGESTTFLLDANGTVIARNLYGSDLAFAVRNALGR